MLIYLSKLCLVIVNVAFSLKKQKLPKI